MIIKIILEIRNYYEIIMKIIKVAYKKCNIKQEKFSLSVYFF